MTLGPLSEKLAKLGIRSRMDLVLHLPLRYEDETRTVLIGQALPGQSVQIEAQVLRCEVLQRPRRQLVVQVQDASGELTLRFLHFYGSQLTQMAPGRWLRAFGEIRGGFFGTEIVHPRYRMIEAGAPLPDRLTPIYPTTEGVSQSQLKRMIHQSLAQVALTDTVPEAIVRSHGLASFEESIRLLHAPPPEVRAEDLLERAHPAWMRIKFDELLAQQLSLTRARAGRLRRVARPLPARHELTQRLQEVLPFALTPAQARVWGEIAADLQQSYPMQRLLQGDVGSGKTVVAALACAQAIENGRQAALMVPTEILAEQHYQKLCTWFQPLGVQVAWLTGSLKAAERRAGLAQIESGAAQLVVGTHALIQEAAVFADLGLMVVDEQHRFGVGQRLALRNKAAVEQPHQLMMSATPIPRTLAMTYFADLDVSVIDALPPGRTPVVTKLVSDARRAEVIERVEAAAQLGRQMYWVCPLIEESEKLDLQNAEASFADLQASLPGLAVGLIHGRLPAAQKAETMQAFVEGRLQLLVCTTVIEVGVDVPNASLMVIEHAERFGLSQLHQLRGRVGRGSAESACILLYQAPLSPQAKERLRTMHQTCDGFEIARKDLELRGPGEFLGSRQSGLALLRFADLQRDQSIVPWARDAAQWMLEHDLAAVEAHLGRWANGREDFLKT